MPSFSRHYLLLAVAGLSHAATIPRPSINTLSKRQNSAPAQDDVSGWCSNVDRSFGDADAVAAVWNDWGIGKAMDNNLIYFGQDDYVVSIANAAISNAGNTGAYGCQEMGQECLPDLPSCSEFVEAGHAQDYWILSAVRNMQAVFERAHEQLQDVIITDTLSINVIADQFEVTVPADEGAPKWLLAALNTGAAAFGIANPGSALGATFLAQFASVVGAGDDGGTATPSTGDMSNLLKGFFSSARTELENTLSTAAGGGGDYGSLPDQGDCTSNGDPCVTDVAGFFADGKFLRQDDDIVDLFTEGYPIFRKKLVDLAMQTAKYEIYVCSPDYYIFCDQFYGNQRIETSLGERSFVLVNHAGEYIEEVPDQINLIQEQYGINMIDYYTACFECYDAGSPQIDIDDLPTDGSLPTCFFNMKLTKGNDDALPT